MTGRRLPPVIETGVVQLVLIVIGGIYLASHLPRQVSLTLPTILLVAAAALLVGNAVALARAKDLARHRFLTVGKWTLLAYGISAGLIEYAFVRNDTRGGPLVVLTLSLVVYALTVPMLIAFTVARYVPQD
jgi:hypothetical protein